MLEFGINWHIKMAKLYESHHPMFIEDKIFALETARMLIDLLPEDEKSKYENLIARHNERLLSDRYKGYYKIDA